MCSRANHVPERGKLVVAQGLFVPFRDVGGVGKSVWENRDRFCTMYKNGNSLNFSTIRLHSRLSVMAGNFALLVNMLSPLGAVHDDTAQPIIILNCTRRGGGTNPLASGVLAFGLFGKNRKKQGQTLYKNCNSLSFNIICLHQRLSVMAGNFALLVNILSPLGAVGCRSR
jgi:hypothetical protein